MSDKILSEDELEADVTFICRRVREGREEKAREVKADLLNHDRALREKNEFLEVALSEAEKALDKKREKLNLTERQLKIRKKAADGADEDIKELRAKLEAAENEVETLKDILRDIDKSITESASDTIWHYDEKRNITICELIEITLIGGIR